MTGYQNHLLREDPHKYINSLLELVDVDPVYEQALRSILEIERETIDGGRGWDADALPPFVSGDVFEDIYLTEILTNEVVKDEQVRVLYRTQFHPDLLEMLVDAVVNADTLDEAMEQCADQIATIPLPGGATAKEVFVPSARAADFHDLVEREGDMVRFWASRVCPHIVGLENIKSALVLSAVSADDAHEDRARLHVLLHGEPGSAKSQLARWMSRVTGGEFCSQKTTRVGLLGDARGAEITPGALSRADGRIISIDELDKFGDGDRQGLLEAMEDGVIHIEGGGKSATFSAMCRVVACANDISRFSPELLDRFDFVFELHVPDVEEKKAIVSNIAKTWRSERKGYSGEDFGLFVGWVRGFDPGIPEEVREYLEGVLKDLVERHEQEGHIYGIRTYESVIRIAFARARLHRRDMTAGDVDFAVDLLLSSDKIPCGTTHRGTCERA